MSGPGDEGILLDQTGACLYQSTEKRIDTYSTTRIARTARSRYATDGLTR
jgi:hypothetical protein